jgi:hypothetical protein
MPPSQLVFTLKLRSLRNIALTKASIDAFIDAMLRRLRSFKVCTSWDGGITAELLDHWRSPQ